VGTESWPAGVLVALVAGFLGLWLARRGLARIAAAPEIPRFEQMREWIRTRLA
jgi:hypothetical protein